MSGARKIVVVSSSAHYARVDSARDHHGKCCNAVTDAEAGVKAARTALEAAPRDPRERAIAREALVMAEEDLEAAKAGLCAADETLRTSERARDEADALALGGLVSRAAVAAEADALCRLFEKEVVGGMRRFLSELIERRVSLMARAKALQIIWQRLDNGFRVPGVDIELGTGTAAVPPIVSLDGLTSIEMKIRSRLQEQVQEQALASDHVGGAAIRFLLVALAPEQREHHSGRTLHEVVWDRFLAGGKTR